MKFVFIKSVSSKHVGFVVAQHPSYTQTVSQGQICRESFTCSYTEIEVADLAILPSHSILTSG